jgi:hypothetical protein
MQVNLRAVLALSRAEEGYLHVCIAKIDLSHGVEQQANITTYLLRFDKYSCSVGALKHLGSVVPRTVTDGNCTTENAAL